MQMQINIPVTHNTVHTTLYHTPLIINCTSGHFFRLKENAGRHHSAVGYISLQLVTIYQTADHNRKIVMYVFVEIVTYSVGQRGVVDKS